MVVAIIGFCIYAGWIAVIWFAARLTHFYLTVCDRVGFAAFSSFPDLSRMFELSLHYFEYTNLEMFICVGTETVP